MFSFSPNWLEVQMCLKCSPGHSDARRGRAVPRVYWLQNKCLGSPPVESLMSKFGLPFELSGAAVPRPPDRRATLPNWGLRAPSPLCLTAAPAPQPVTAGETPRVTGRPCCARGKPGGINGHPDRVTLRVNSCVAPSLTSG